MQGGCRTHLSVSSASIATTMSVPAHAAHQCRSRDVGDTRFNGTTLGVAATSECADFSVVPRQELTPIERQLVGARVGNFCGRHDSAVCPRNRDREAFVIVAVLPRLEHDRRTNEANDWRLSRTTSNSLLLAWRRSQRRRASLTITAWCCSGAGVSPIDHRRSRSSSTSSRSRESSRGS